MLISLHHWSANAANRGSAWLQYTQTLPDTSVVTFIGFSTHLSSTIGPTSNPILTCLIYFPWSVSALLLLQEHFPRILSVSSNPISSWTPGFFAVTCRMMDKSPSLELITLRLQWAQMWMRYERFGHEEKKWCKIAVEEGPSRLWCVTQGWTQKNGWPNWKPIIVVVDWAGGRGTEMMRMDGVLICSYSDKVQAAQLDCPPKMGHMQQQPTYTFIPHLLVYFCPQSSQTVKLQLQFTSTLSFERNHFARVSSTEI